MAYEKGQSGNLSGRPKGLPNKSTITAREAIATFVDGNADRLTKWLDEIAVTSPKDAFNCFMSVVEYHIPKLARSEVTGKDGGAIETKASIPEEDRKLMENWLEQRTKK